jgi:hypothetical protein
LKSTVFANGRKTKPFSKWRNRSVSDCDGRRPSRLQAEHGINLTNSKTFDEFVDEVRNDKRSGSRVDARIQTAAAIASAAVVCRNSASLPEFPEGRKKWFDRVHFDIGDGHGLRPLSVHWVYGGPAWLRAAIWTLGVLGSPKARPIFSLTRKKRPRAEKLRKNRI